MVNAGGNKVINHAAGQNGVTLSGTITGLAAGATFPITVTDGAFSKIYTATVSTTGTGWTATIPSNDTTALANGTATVTAQVTDPYGNQSSPATQTLTVAETLPTVTISAINGNNVINHAQAVTSGGVPLSGSVSGLAPGATFTVIVTDGAASTDYTATVDGAGTGWTARIPSSDATSMANGAATVTAQVTDPYGNQSLPVTQAFTVNTQGPSVSGIVLGTGLLDGTTPSTSITVSFSAPVTDFTGADLVLPSGVTVSNGVLAANGLSFTATLTAGANIADESQAVAVTGGSYHDAFGNAGAGFTGPTLTVNVTPVNDAPSGTSATVTTNEDTGYVFGVADFGFSDPNDTPANSLLAVKITTLPGAGTLTDNGVAVTAGQFVSVADITAGKLVFTPAANANGNNYAQFTFQVQDNGGTGNGGVDLDPTPKTLTVNVTPVNDAPSGTSATVTTNEDTGYVFGVADFGFSDPNDTPANSLQAVKVTTLPGAGTLTDNGVAVTAGQFVSVADITAGKLVFTPAANANGNNYAQFTFQVQDNGGTGNGGVDLDPTPKTLTVNVTPVNDAPSGADATVTTNEDTAYVFGATDFGFSDPNDTPANSLQAVKITTLPGAGTLTDNGVAVTAGQFVSVADITAGKLVFTPAANANGNNYASVHVPGAGQRRHRQWRG